MASVIFDSARLAFLNGECDWEANDFEVMLTKTYSPAAGHTVLSDGAIAGELADASYQAEGDASEVGRFILQNKTAAVASNRAEAQADNVTWAALTGETVTHAVIYKQLGGADADNLLVVAIDIADVALTGLDLVLKWNGGATAGAVFKI
jgi:hypothetical protein